MRVGRHTFEPHGLSVKSVPVIKVGRHTFEQPGLSIKPVPVSIAGWSSYVRVIQLMDKSCLGQNEE